MSRTPRNLPRGLPMLPKRNKRLVGLPGLVAGLLLMAGCGRPAVPPPASMPASSNPGTVSIVHPQKKSLKRVVEQPGLVQAFEETQLFARVPGYVRKLRPDIDIGYRIRGPKYDDAGKEVEPGEVLAELAVPE